MYNFLKKNRNLGLVFFDICIIVLAYFLTYFFKERNPFSLSFVEIQTTVYTATIAIVLNIIFLRVSKLYKSVTRYESGKDYVKYGLNCIIVALILSAIQPFFVGIIPLHGIRTNLLAALISTFFMITYRIIIKVCLTKNYVLFQKKENIKRKNLLIIGAGSAGKEVISTIESSLNKEYKVVGLIDDNIYKKRYLISNVEVLGNRYDIENVCKEKNVEEIFFTITNISKEDKKEILGICKNTKAKVKVLPSLEDFIKGKQVIEHLRDVEIEDLLGREPIKLDNSKIKPLIENEVVMVTGAGGSIGSELCRQIIKYNPRILVMFDIYENTLYDIEMELIRSEYNKNNIKAIIGSIRDKKRLNEVIGEYRPSLVFHAAAHKHVPLMEASPLEAIKNNIFGTWKLINSCDEHGVKRFIQISTDKAVNPTNIMGATKRMCELMIQAKDKSSQTDYAAVRFGNVLGSNGSVIPLFKKQIKEGGPVTLTHKEITRYFMTIPEAVSLVIQAMTLAEGGEIFVLDMGKPVKIYDLAVSLIKLSGREPDVDIPIKITGLRPGEKLYEELLMATEGLEKTKYDKIFVEEPNDITVKEIDAKLKLLEETIKEEEVSYKAIKDVMHKVVPTFIEPEEANEKKVAELL